MIKFQKEKVKKYLYVINYLKEGFGPKTHLKGRLIISFKPHGNDVGAMRDFKSRYYNYFKICLILKIFFIFQLLLKIYL